LPYLTSVSCV